MGHLLMSFPVAGEAAGAGLLPGVISEDEYLGLVAATLHMFGSGTVAGLQQPCFEGAASLFRVVFQCGDFSQEL